MKFFNELQSIVKIETVTINARQIDNIDNTKTLQKIQDELIKISETKDIIIKEQKSLNLDNLLNLLVKIKDGLDKHKRDTEIAKKQAREVEFQKLLTEANMILDNILLISPEYITIFKKKLTDIAEEDEEFQIAIEYIEKIDQKLEKRTQKIDKGAQAKKAEVKVANMSDDAKAFKKKRSKRSTKKNIPHAPLLSVCERCKVDLKDMWFHKNPDKNLCKNCYGWLSNEQKQFYKKIDDPSGAAPSVEAAPPIKALEIAKKPKIEQIKLDARKKGIEDRKKGETRTPKEIELALETRRATQKIEQLNMKLMNAKTPEENKRIQEKIIAAIEEQKKLDVKKKEYKDKEFAERRKKVEEDVKREREARRKIIEENVKREREKAKKAEINIITKIEPRAEEARAEETRAEEARAEVAREQDNYYSKYMNI